MKRPPQLDSEEYPLVARKERPDTVVGIGSATVGDGFCLIAGPCAVESEEQIDETARFVATEGAAVLRGGVFKPRTSPYAFQGTGLDGLHTMRRAADAARIPLVTEVPSPELVDAMLPLVDAFQIGARNMQNFPLLKAVGHCDRPVILKRGFASTLTEWLLAAEYIADAGNEAIILCERGIRTFGGELRFTLDLAGALWARRKTHLPIIIDPSHATGHPDLVAPLVHAAHAAGLQGAMVEVHPHPHRALCDASQALDKPAFTALTETLPI